MAPTSALGGAGGEVCLAERAGLSVWRPVDWYEGLTALYCFRSWLFR